jgi:hypothetical protein
VGGYTQQQGNLPNRKVKQMQKVIDIKDLSEIVLTNNGLVVGKVTINIKNRNNRADVVFVGHSVNFTSKFDDISLRHLDTNNEFWSGESINAIDPIRA